MKLKTLALLAFPLLLNAEISRAQLTQKEEIARLLSGFTLGNDPFYNKAISPGKNPDVSKSNADRTAAVNTMIANEISTVLSAFENAPDAEKKAAVVAVIQRYDKELVDKNQAHIQFISGSPSAAISRTILMFEKPNPEAVSQKVLDTFTSYKRSAKSSDYVYEYENARDLTSGKIKALSGTDTSWLLPQAAAPLKLDSDLAIKKCRKIFGWRCGTSIYKAGEMEKNAKYFYVGNYDLKNNPDHAEFARDGRASNQISGNTALYLIVENDKWVLLYGLDSQWKDSDLSFTSMIQDEFQKDLARLKQRIAADLKLN